MLVAISGSQGSGKSTVLAALKAVGYTTIERKTSRSILDDWGVTLQEVNNNHDLTIKFQKEIINRKYQDERYAVLSNEVYFTERTYADLFTYALVTLGKDNEYSDWLDQYFVDCTELQLEYNLVYYLKAGHFTPVHDGVRGSNKHYSRMVDLTMLDITERMTPAGRLLTLDTPRLEDRAGIIISGVQTTQRNQDHFEQCQRHLYEDD